MWKTYFSQLISKDQKDTFAGINQEFKFRFTSKDTGIINHSLLLIELSTKSAFEETAQILLSKEGNSSNQYNNEE